LRSQKRLEVNLALSTFGSFFLNYLTWLIRGHFCTIPAPLLSLSPPRARYFMALIDQFRFFTTFSDSLDQIDTSEVKTRTAIIMPIVGSIFLVILFYFLQWIYYLLVAILSFAAFVGMGFVVYPYFEMLTNKLRLMKQWEVRWIGTITIAGILSLVFSLFVVILWLCTEFWILTDALSLALAITSLSSVRLPNLKISSIILGLFFIYDIFWVFLSPYIFKENVMVTVATQLPALPMLVVFPRVLDDGASLLGLGDIVLPGLFLCFLFRIDNWKDTSFKNGYFLRAWIAYAIGLVVTLFMVFFLQRGQPALLYLVPATLFTTYFFAWRRNQFRELWSGASTETPTTTSDHENTNESEVSLLSDDDVERGTTQSPKEGYL